MAGNNLFLVLGTQLGCWSAVWNFGHWSGVTARHSTPQHSTAFGRFPDVCGRTRRRAEPLFSAEGPGNFLQYEEQLRNPTADKTPRVNIFKRLRAPDFTGGPEQASPDYMPALAGDHGTYH